MAVKRHNRSFLSPCLTLFTCKINPREKELLIVYGSYFYKSLLCILTASFFQTSRNSGFLVTCSFG